MTKKERAIEFINIAASLHPIRVLILTRLCHLSKVVLKKEFIEPLEEKLSQFDLLKEGHRWVFENTSSQAKIYAEPTMGTPMSGSFYHGSRYDIIVLHDWARFSPEFIDRLRALNGFTGSPTKQLKDNMAGLNGILSEEFGETLPAFIQL